MDRVRGMVVGGQKAGLSSLPPPSFPEHFREFVGFDAQQLLR